MELLVANLVGRTRRETIHGREYLVAPGTLITPGVLNGSKGRLYYPPEEVAKNPDDWNGMPIVGYHPVRDGQHVSARDPEILGTQGLGHVYRTTVNGKLGAELWFDVAAAEAFDATLPPAVRILPRIERGEPVELSTGLFTDNEPAPPGATHNGKSYDFVARNYRPDHLAILPDQVGACSLQDGCGVLVNGATTNCDGLAPDAGLMPVPPPSPLYAWIEAFWRFLTMQPPPTLNALPNQPKSKATGKWKRLNAGTGKGDVHEAAQKGALTVSDRDRQLGAEAMRHEEEEGGDLPPWAADEPKWRLAAEAATKAGRRGEAYWAAAAHIYQGLGGAVAGEITTNAEGSTVALTPAQRAALVNGIVANCDCWKEAGDRETLNKLSDAKLQKIKAAADRSKKFAPLANLLTVNAEADGEIAGVNLKDLADFLGVTTDPANDPVGFMKEIMGALQAVLDKLKMDPEDQQDAAADESAEAATPADMAANRRARTRVAALLNRPKAKKPATANDWLATAPAEIQSAVRNAMSVEQRERDALIGRLTANLADDARKHLAARLKGKPLDELRDLAPLAPPARAKDEPADFFGAAGGPAANRLADDELTDEDAYAPPAYDWEAIAKEQRRQRA